MRQRGQEYANTEELTGADWATFFTSTTRYLGSIWTHVRKKAVITPPVAMWRTQRTSVMLREAELASN